MKNECFAINKLKASVFALLCILLSTEPIFSVSVNSDIYDLDLVQLSKLKITSVSKVSQNISEIPSTVFVITSAQIKENGYFMLDEALSDLPGFQFRNTLGINSYIFQRGIPNQNNLTLLLIDGVQVNELNSGGFYAGGTYNLSNVERIEVIYGPSSVAYGTNAMAGVINIITKEPVEKKIEQNAAIGSFNTSENNINCTYVNDKKTFGMAFAGMVKKTEKANLKGGAGDNNWTDLMDNFEDDYSFNLKLNIKDFTVGSNYIYKRASLATWSKSVGSIYKDYGTSWNIRFINNYVKYKKNMSKNISLSSILYNRDTTVLDDTVYYVTTSSQTGYYRPNNLTGLENILYYEINKSVSLTGGLTFEYEYLSEHNSWSYSNSPEIKPPRPVKPKLINNTLQSIFIEPQIMLYKNLFLSGGIRFDHSSVYDDVLTPRAGVNYHFQNHILRFLYAEAFRAPKPWDYTDGTGNSSLIPEELKSFEAGVTFSLKDNYKLELTGYKNKLGNAILKDVINNKWVNSSGDTNTDGTEICFSHTAKKLKSSVNCTFNKSRDDTGQVISEINEHAANASFTYSLDKYLKFNLRANYVGCRKNTKIIAATGDADVEPYLIFHGTLSCLEYKGFNARLMAKNIFNTKYYHTSNREPDRYRQPQRSILLSVGYAFDY
ncbi:MAG: Colicin I receptor precursor [Elusimicrobia bacterium ADurb.Bin231]|nr:MAG: Colicin I receptor precursor [Elusimicrobia bacterium ADurb.Bin231]